MLSRAIAAGFLLAASCQHAVDAQDVVPQAMLGCWDDQFTGGSDSFLRLTKTGIYVSFSADYPTAGHTILSNYTTDIGEGTGVSFIAENDEDNVFCSGLFSDFDFILEPGDNNDEDILYYCQIDYDAETAEAAADEDLDIDYSDYTAGCNGYAWSRMQRSFDRDCVPEKCSKICQKNCPLPKRIFSVRKSKQCRKLRKKKLGCKCPSLLQCDCTRTRRCPSCCQGLTCNKRQKRRCDVGGCVFS